MASIVNAAGVCSAVYGGWEREYVMEWFGESYHQPALTGMVEADSSVCVILLVWVCCRFFCLITLVGCEHHWRASLARWFTGRQQCALAGLQLYKGQMWHEKADLLTGLQCAPREACMLLWP